MGQGPATEVTHLSFNQHPVSSSDTPLRTKTQCTSHPSEA